MDADLENALDRAAESYPYPIAAACAEVKNTDMRDGWHEWELLSRDLLTPVLTYLSHLLLSDLVATDQEPAHLFHRIESILSRPLAGHYVGFLRETAKYYREEDVETAIPELVEFLLAAEVDHTLTEAEQPLLDELVNYRNRWAHGRIENEEIVERNLSEIRRLTRRLLGEIEFLTDFPLTLEDGTLLMGHDPNLPEKPLPLVTISAKDVSLRPLLLKLEGREVSILSEADLQEQRLTYRSPKSYTQFSNDDFKENEEAARLFEELKSLLREVRNLEAELPKPDLDSFRRRASVQTDRMLTLYGKSDLGKYDPDLYIPRPEWEGENGRFSDFLSSKKTLLAIDGEQGTGKSALAARLAELSDEEGHAVWFLNAQRFTFANVSWSGNPYPRYFADRLNYEKPLDRSAIEDLAKETDDHERLIIFVDGINEIDYISNKWNRFKAISLLLEWVDKVSHPQLKVVLTFRTEAYRQFDYLEAEDVPDGIETFSYVTGNHPRPWIHTLSPFAESQAKQLYNKLQHTSKGMAPDMDWGQITTQLKDNMRSFVANPLLFTIFLRAHDGQSEVISNNRDELLQQYIDGVTGARERKSWPFWKRAYYFVKNGNITEKEQFLSDCAEKTTDTGSTGFLVSQLDTNKDIDTRISHVLTDARNKTILRQLKETGIIFDDTINTTDDNHHSDRRISFSSELVRKAMGRVLTNKKKRESLQGGIQIFKQAVKMLGVFLIIISTITVVFSTIPWIANNEIPTVNYYYGPISVIGYYTFNVILLFITAIILSVYSDINQEYIGVDKKGIMESFFEYNIDSKLSEIFRFFFEWAVLILIIAGLINALNSLFDIFTYNFSFVYGCFVSITMIMVILIPHVNNYAVRHELTSNTRVLKKAITRLIGFYEKYTATPNLPATLIVLFVLAVILYISYHINTDLLKPFTTQTLGSTKEALSSHLSYYWYSKLVFPFDTYIFRVTVFIVLTLTPIAILGPILSRYVTKKNLEVYRMYIGYSSCNKQTVIAVVGLIYVFLLPLGYAPYIPDLDDVFPTLGKNTRIHKSPKVESSILAHIDTTQHNRLSIDLTSYPNLSSSDVSLLRSIDLDRVILRNNHLRSLNLTKFHSLSYLTIHGDSISLTPRHKNYNLQILKIPTAAKAEGLAGLFPHLNVIIASEELFTRKNDVPEIWKNAIIRLNTHGSPDLEWLSQDDSTYIYDLSNSPTSNTSNLPIIQHATFPADELRPDVLSRMTNLRWLYLTNSPCAKEDVPPEKTEFCNELERIENSRPLNIDHSKSEAPFVRRRLDMFASQEHKTGSNITF